MRPPTHRDTLVEQFTRQAEPFSLAPGIRDADALAQLVAASGAGADDTVLDVACGPGLVVAAFAAVARHATGIDLTPAMLARARVLAAGRALVNVAWEVGDALSLPHRDATFSVVTSRFAFHHCPDPRAVLAEMTRVCRPGGRVVVVDLLASDDPARAAAFHAMEMLRDPSHVRALPLAGLTALFPAVGLPSPAVSHYRLKVEVEGLLQRSFPAAGDVERIRALFAASLVDDAMGLGIHRRGTEIRFAYRVAILTAALQ